MDDIIALILSAKQDNDEYNFVSPTTVLDSGNTEQDFNNTKNFILDELDIEEYDASSLVDTYIELNKESITLSVKSDIKNGFIIDHDEALIKYLHSNGDGWEKLQEDYPKAKSWVEISRLAYDPESHIALIYFEKNFYDELFGSDVIGFYYAFKYEDNRLVLLDSIVSLMS